MAGVADYIDALTQSPTYKVAYGGGWLTNVISIERDPNWDQYSSTCRITIATTLNLNPNMTSEIKVFEGYNNNYAQTFTGYVDDIVRGRFPDTWVLVCRDVLKRAIETWLDDEGVSYSVAQAETAVVDLLSKAGITVVADTTNFTIGDVNPAEFKLMSVMDAAMQIANLIGWRIWAGVDGTVYFKYARPLPSSTSSWTYTRGTNVLKYDYTRTDRNLRNRIVVVGWDEIRSVASAGSPYVPNPPGYRTAILSSELIDTQSMADTIAAWMLSSLNHLTDSIEMECVGNPLLRVGDTVHFTDSERSIDAHFFIYGIRSQNNGEQGSYTQTMTIVAGDGVTSPNYEPPPGDEPPPGGEPPPTGYGNTWRSKIYLLTTAGVYYSSDFTGPGGTMPTWTLLNGGLPVNYIPIAFEPDAFRPADRQYLLLTNLSTNKQELYVRTTGDWSKLTDADAIATLWASAWGSTLVNCTLWAIQSDINRDGWIGMHAGGFYHGSNHRHAYLYSADYGVTWTVCANDADLDTSTDPGSHYIEIGDYAGNSGYNGGDLVYMPIFSVGALSYSRLVKSVDRGINWTLVDSTIDWEEQGLYTDVYQDILYRWKFGGSEFDAGSKIWRSVDQGATWTEIYAGATYGALSSGFGTVAVFRYKCHPILGPMTGALILRTVSWNNRLCYSVDGGVTWTRSALPTGLTGETNLSISLVQDSDAKIYGLNTKTPITDPVSRSIYVSSDEGVTWESKAGPNAGTSPYTDSIPYHAGVLGILQVWNEA